MTSRTFTIKDLFESNFFVIPDYQRGYSWEEHHLKDLVKDIESISKLENSHYTGTIVATKVESKDDTFEIVDGQQRLTSLVILLNEIYNLSPDRFSGIKPLFLIRGRVGQETIVLCTNKETRDCYEQAIINGKPYLATIKSHESLINAKLFFSTWLIEKNLDEVYHTVTEKLNFLFFTPAFNKEIGIMFEVINNRGKQLSELEKIKNFFIYFSTIHNKETLRREINNRWADIQKYLSQANRTSNDDENAFLRYCYLVYFKASKDKSWNVYDELKLIFDIEKKSESTLVSYIERMRGFVDFLLHASLHYAWFFNHQYFLTSYNLELKKELDQCLTYLRCQPVFASIMPLYLSIMTRLSETDRVVKLLKLLEIVNMRLYVLPDIFRRADSKQADLFSYAYEFYNDPHWNSDGDPAVTNYNEVEIEGDVFDWLYQNLIQITYRFCSSERFVDNLELTDNEDFNFYRWQGIRFFLACYEEEITAKRAKRTFNIHRILSGKKSVGKNFNDQLSLEHIWASKNRIEDFPENFHTKRRLGNFVLCGLSSNINLSHNDLTEKVSRLVIENNAGEGALDMLQVAQLPKFLNAILQFEMNEYKRQTKNYWRDLASKLCDKREEELIKFALKRWRLPNEKLLKT